jgi:hypothetical protein
MPSFERQSLNVWCRRHTCATCGSQSPQSSTEFHMSCSFPDGAITSVWNQNVRIAHIAGVLRSLIPDADQLMQAKISTDSDSVNSVWSNDQINSVPLLICKDPSALRQFSRRASLNNAKSSSLALNLCFTTDSCQERIVWGNRLSGWVHLCLPWRILYVLSDFFAADLGNLQLARS